MSSTDDSVREAREETSTAARNEAGRVRRMAVKLTEGGSWQVAGHLLLDSRTREVADGDIFGGVGFASRPAARANAEAVVAFPGGASNPVIVATRDEDLRRAMASLAQNETAIFNRLVTALCRANGTVEVRAATGPVQSTILGETYRSAEDTMLTLVAAAFTALAGAPALAAPVQEACTAAAGAINTFQLAAPSYLTQVLKTQ